MHHDLLTDKTGVLAVLVNVEIAKNSSRIYCGLAYFRGGLAGTIALYSPRQEGIVAQIIVPDSAMESATNLVLSHPMDLVEVNLDQKIVIPPHESNHSEK